MWKNPNASSRVCRRIATKFFAARIPFSSSSSRVFWRAISTSRGAHFACAQCGKWRAPCALAHVRKPSLSACRAGAANALDASLRLALQIASTPPTCASKNRDRHRVKIFFVTNQCIAIFEERARARRAARMCSSSCVCKRAARRVWRGHLHARSMKFARRAARAACAKNARDDARKNMRAARNASRKCGQCARKKSCVERGLMCVGRVRCKKK